MIIPKINVPTTNGESPKWVKKTIGDILTIYHGKDYKHLGKGDIPVMGTGGVIAHVDTPLCDWNCVCIGRKGTIDKPYYMDHPFWSVDTLFYTKPKDGYDPLFQYYLFHTINWQKYNEASGVPSLSAKTIGKIEVMVPESLEVQNKIAGVLASIDALIAEQEGIIADLEERKKGLLKKIFSQELRFKADDGSEFPAWEPKILGDLGSVSMCKRVFKEQTDESGDIPFFKIGTFGGIPDAFIPRSLFEELKSKYPYPEKGNILLSAAGTIGRTVVYGGEDAYYQDSNIVWLNHNDSILDEFLYHFYNSVSWGNLEGGTVKRLYNSILLEKEIALPSIPEQRKIAALFDMLDEEIKNTKAILDDWKTLKTGLLQQMFV